MKFDNRKSERIKFCLGYKHDYAWVTVRPGESVELDEEHEDRARSHGLSICEDCEVKAEYSSVGNVEVETKQVKPKGRSRRRGK